MKQAVSVQLSAVSKTAFAREAVTSDLTEPTRMLAGFIHKLDAER